MPYSPADVSEREQIQGQPPAKANLRLEAFFRIIPGVLYVDMRQRPSADDNIVSLRRCDSKPFNHHDRV